jgi:hypothetical protein
MPQTTNGAEGLESSAPYKQAGRPGAMVTDRREAERSRRSRRWAQRELDALLDVREPAPAEIDYAACGLTLGMPERRAGGLALLQLERAA